MQFTCVPESVEGSEVRLMANEWNKENYDASLTCQGLQHTFSSWEELERLGVDNTRCKQIKALFQEEHSLESIPDWAEQIVKRMIRPMALCGHYAFPLPMIQLTHAINEERCPSFVCTCYTADSKRKTLMSYYIYCLDAWIKSAPLDIAQSELALRPELNKDWPRIVAMIYAALGERSYRKNKVMERLIHRMRWWLKSMSWLDDKRNRFQLDVYSGDVRGNEKDWGDWGNFPFGSPFYIEAELPRLVQLNNEIRETVPEGDKYLNMIENSWLCAPKAFRYLEKLIIEIGRIDSDAPSLKDRPILRCEENYPNIQSQHDWYTHFMITLQNWIKNNGEDYGEFGASTPVKHWLGRMIWLKLKLYERYHNFGKLVGMKSSGKKGHLSCL